MNSPMWWSSIDINHISASCVSMTLDNFSTAVMNFGSYSHSLASFSNRAISPTTDVGMSTANCFFWLINDLHKCTTLCTSSSPIWNAPCVMEEAKRFLLFLHWHMILDIPEVSFPAYNLILGVFLIALGRCFSNVATLLGMLGSCHPSVGAHPLTVDLQTASSPLVDKGFPQSTKYQISLRVSTH